MRGKGAGPFMADYRNDEKLRAPEFRKTNIDEWRLACDAIATDVYAFEGWDRAYRRVFRERLSAPALP